MPQVNTGGRAAPRVAPRSKSTSADKPRAWRVFGCRLLALAFVAILGILLAHYPPGPIWATAALVAYSALLWRKPELWLLAVPALLPVLDFSAWTGWFYVREGDLLILATLAVGYWRVVPLSAGLPLPRAA